jgi:hypothetical protein
MRTQPAVAAVILALATPAAADGPIRLELEVGQKAVVGGYTAMCDDPSIATISLGGQATITALKPGRTTCSARVNAVLRIFDVTVKAPAPAAPTPAPGAPRGGGEGEKR